MKKLLLLAIMGLSALSAWAADEAQTMVFKHRDGSLQSIAAPGLSMSIADGNIVAVNGAQTLSVALSTLECFYFAEESSGVTNLVNPASAFEVYTLEGLYAGRFASVADCKDALGAGVYVVKTEVSTFKIVLP